jgi:hypothetical protein
MYIYSDSMRVCMSSPLSEPTVTIHVSVGIDKLRALDEKIAVRRLPDLQDRSKVIKRLIDIYLEDVVDNIMVKTR